MPIFSILVQIWLAGGRTVCLAMASLSLKPVETVSDSSSDEVGLATPLILGLTLPSAFQWLEVKIIVHPDRRHLW